VITSSHYHASFIKISSPTNGASCFINPALFLIISMMIRDAALITFLSDFAKIIIM